MIAKKKPAKKVKKPKVRVPAGSMSCACDSVASLIENLLQKGFRLEDLDKTSIELDYSGCYYPDDTPSICIEWDDIV